MSEIHGATGSYVVNALDPDELDEFEAHLEVCPTCRREITEFCETAAQLPLLAGAPAPSPGLRKSVLAGIAEVRPLPPLTGTPRRALAGVDGGEHIGTPDPDDDTSPDDASRGFVAPRPVTAKPDPMLDELALRRSHRRTRVLTGLVAAVTVIALALGGVVYTLVQRQQPPTAAPAVDPSLVGAPDATIYTKKLPNGAHVSYVVSKSQDRAVFVSNDLPSPGPGKVYQLWTLRDGTATPDQTVQGAGAERTQTFRGPVKNSTGLALTIEPGPGSQTPTKPIMAQVSI